MIKVLLCAFFVVGTFSSPIDVDDESNEFRIRYLTTQDENGNIQVEDLDQPEPRASVAKSTVFFRLHTRASPEEPELIVRADQLSNIFNYENFDRTLPIQLTIHGWKGQLTEEVNTAVTKATLQNEATNCFVVDWTYPADNMYTTAKGNVPEVGAIVGDFLLFLINQVGVDASQIRVIGFSLGAHVAGFAAKKTKSMGHLLPEVIGLDPAGPLYSSTNTATRLDKSDAKYVKIVHTSGGLAGLSTAIGHIDFYPNGGKSQEGCGLDLLGSCAHMRAPVIYAEAIRKQSSFESFPAKSYSDFKKGKYTGPSTYMGTDTNKARTGIFYLNTNGYPPYSF